ncbi:MAG: SRPBCC domain-containing protein [Terriglobales bacterium]
MAFTRRQFSLNVASSIGLSGIVLATSQNQDNEISHTADAIHQEISFSVEPKRIYDALLDTKQFDEMNRLIPSMQTAKLGNSPTKISRELGGPFTLFRGHIIGRHVEFVPNQRIVQAWRVVDWDPGVYSIVKFELYAQGAGTRLVFNHTGFPVGLARHLADGWKEHYWEPLQKYLT